MPTDLRICAGLDADVLIMAYVLDTSVSSTLCEGGTVASALPYLFEQGTGRPLVGVMLLCSLFGRIEADIMVIAHEITHALVFHPALINNFPSYEAGGLLDGQSPVAQEAGGKTYITTPQVRVPMALLHGCTCAARWRSQHSPSVLAPTADMRRACSEG